MSKDVKPVGSGSSSSPKKKNNRKDKGEPSDTLTKFQGEGLAFKAKLYGTVDVQGARGDAMCQSALQSLKSAMKGHNYHKQKIVVKINTNGVVLVDATNNQRKLAEHKLNKISFISKDTTDNRSFSYIVGNDDGKHLLYGIKTDKPAETVLLAFRDLFQAVTELQQRDSTQKRASSSSSTSGESNGKASSLSTGTNKDPKSSDLPLNIPVDEDISPNEEKGSSPTDNLKVESSLFVNEPKGSANVNLDVAGVSGDGHQIENLKDNGCAVGIQNAKVTAYNLDISSQHATPLSTSQHTDSLQTSQQTELGQSTLEEPKKFEVQAETTLASHKETSTSLESKSVIANNGDEMNLTHMEPNAQGNGFETTKDTALFQQVFTDKNTGSSQGGDLTVTMSPFVDQSKTDNHHKSKDQVPSNTENVGMESVADATNPWATEPTVQADSSNPWANFDVDENISSHSKDFGDDPWADSPFGLSNETKATPDAHATVDPFTDSVSNNAFSSELTDKGATSAFSSAPVELSTNTSNVNDVSSAVTEECAASPFSSSTTVDPFANVDSKDLFPSTVADKGAASPFDGESFSSIFPELTSDPFHAIDDLFSNLPTTAQKTDVLAQPGVENRETINVELKCEPNEEQKCEPDEEQKCEPNEEVNSESLTHHGDTSSTIASTNDNGESNSNSSRTSPLSIKSDIVSDTSGDNQSSFAPPSCPAPTLPPELLAQVDPEDFKPVTSPSPSGLTVASHLPALEKRGPPPAIPARRPVSQPASLPPVPARNFERSLSSAATPDAVDAKPLLSPAPSFPPPQLPASAQSSSPPKIPARRPHRISENDHSVSPS